MPDESQATETQGRAADADDLDAASQDGEGQDAEAQGAEAREGQVMGDEIRDANVITLHCERDEHDKPTHWVARIGPEGQGVVAQGTNPIEALIALTMSLHLDKWPFDQTWKPHAEAAPAPTRHAVEVRTLDE